MPPRLDFKDNSTLHHIAEFSGFRYEIASSWPNIFTAWVFRKSDDILVCSTWFKTYGEAQRFLECEAFAPALRMV